MRCLLAVILVLSLALSATACEEEEQAGATATPAQATATPTEATATPVEPTVTPVEPTPTPVEAAVPEGWERHTMARFQIDLPQTWDAWDPTQETLDTIVQELGSLNPEFAALFEQTATTAPVEFLAIDTESVEFLDNLNIIRYEGSVPPTVPVAIAELEGYYADLGVTVLATDSDLTIGGEEAGSIQISITLGPYETREVQYFVLLQPNLMYILTFSAGPENFDALEPLFEQMAESFRVLESP